MQKIIPVYYSEYGRYINRFRAIPFYIDCLKPVERRILLTLHEDAKSTTKSAKVVGFAIGKYHPHGDQSCYGTLVNLVNQKFAVGEGNWGSPGLIDAREAAMRYTQCKLSSWVEKLAFSYIDYVPWEEFELEKEPLYLPSPIPLGLIGEGIITGISFYRTLIPKYKLSDLAARLTWLLEHNKLGININLPDEKINLTTAGPAIQPNIKGCQLSEEGSNQFYNILLKGTGSINTIPDGKIEGKTIKILGRSPNSSFTSLTEKKEELEIYLNDLSKSEIDIEISPKKRSTNLTTLGSKIWKDHLIKKHNFNCIVCDMEGVVNTVGIDEILSNNYQAWKYSVLLKNVDDYIKLNDKKIELLVVQMIRYIFEKYNSTKVSEIILRFKELVKDKNVEVEIEKYNIESAKYQKENRKIDEQDIINTCNKKNIKSLIEADIDIKKVESEILAAKIAIDGVDKSCFNIVKDLQKFKI